MSARNLNRIVISAFAMCMAVVAFMSTGVMDSGDGLAHYTISRSSWNTPKLLLDHWGKPLFTLFSSPFAQLGYKGMLVFNILCSIFTALLIVRICKGLNVKRSWWALLFLFCAPVYYKMVISGLTEILFALVLTFAVERIVSMKYAQAMVIASFLPFARPEGYLILPLLALFVLLRDWKALPWILVGPVLYGIWGYFVFDNFFWMISNDPYVNKDPGVYGFGHPLDFVKQAKVIAGIPITFLFLFATSWWIYSGFATKSREKGRDVLMIILVFILPITGVFVGHAYLWWKGLNGSYGLVRVLATIIPLVAVVAGLGFDHLLSLVKKKPLSIVIQFVVLAVVVGVFIDKSKFNITFGEKDQLVVTASEWVSNNYPDKKIYYLDPLVAYAMSLDPYDKESSDRIFFMDKKKPSITMSSGEILVWESHYSPQEGHMSKEVVLADPDLELLKEFHHPESFIIFENREHEVYIMQRK